MTYIYSNTNQKGAFLCADIGGTNFRLAAVVLDKGVFKILKKENLATPSIKDPAPYFANIRNLWEKELGLTFTGMGLALAGPVTDQKCRMTNANLEIDGAVIQKATGLPVYLMNDLAAVTWGVAAIDHRDATGITHLGGPDSSTVNHGTIRKSVVAPGTGLGVGGLVIKKGVTAVLDTESGHIDFAPRGADAGNFQNFIQSRFKELPGYEQFVSGLGFEYLFEYYLATHPSADSPALEEVQNAHGPSRGAVISKHAVTDPHCRSIMESFIFYLGRFSATIALTHLPRSGLYLAGGVPGKNIPWFVENNRFMESFLQNYLGPIKSLLGQIPVYLVDDNDIGLYGAAHGCLSEAGN